MNDFGQENSPSEDSDLVQITDLDPGKDGRRRVPRKVLAVARWWLFKWWGRGLLAAVLFAILLGSVLPQINWHLVVVPQDASSHRSSSSPSFPAVAKGDLQVQMLEKHPLHFPHLESDNACPTTPENKIMPEFGVAQGQGPVYVTVGTEAIASPSVLSYTDAQHFGNGGRANQGWGGQLVLWFVNPAYRGVVLVRGHQLDGPHTMLFDEDISGRPFSQSLVIDTTLDSAPWPNYGSYTRLQAPGCYAYQIDGENFTYVIIFQAVAQQ